MPYTDERLQTIKQYGNPTARRLNRANWSDQRKQTAAQYGNLTARRLNIANWPQERKQTAAQYGNRIARDLNVYGSSSVYEQYKDSLPRLPSRGYPLRGQPGGEESDRLKGLMDSIQGLQKGGLPSIDPGFFREVEPRKPGDPVPSAKYITPGPYKPGDAVPSARYESPEGTTYAKPPLGKIPGIRERIGTMPTPQINRPADKGIAGIGTPGSVWKPQEMLPPKRWRLRGSVY